MSTRPLRIAFGRIMQETNALSPVSTTLADFERTHLMEGQELLDACSSPLAWEVKGYLRNLELSGFVKAARAFRSREVTPVPLLSAWTISGGPLEKETFDTLVSRLCDRLAKAGDVDGVFLSLHGAMGVRGVPDADTRVIEAVKRVTGGKPVAASFDLHGNLTRARVAATDVISAYHTNPHRDHKQTAARATNALLRSLTGEVRIKTAWRSLPLLLGGGNTVDFLSPMRAIYGRLRSMRKDPRVLDASIFPVHLWNDDPELGWSAIVHTDGEQELAERLADELAVMCWDVRNEQPPRFSSASEAVRDARAAKLARKLGAVVMADASDVVTAGSIGENTALLRVLAEEGSELVSYVPIRDAEVVALAEQHDIGDELTVQVGGKLDPARTEPLLLRATLVSKHTEGPFGRVVVLRAHRTYVCVTSGAPMVMMPSFYKELGLDVWKADVVVVKNFFPFRMFFLPYARKTIYVKTSGITDFDAAYELAFAGPLHPKDQVHEWRSCDRRRRGIELS
jgi:microcystin degradation protein MlrC